MPPLPLLVAAEPFTAPPHGEILTLLVQVCILLATARGLGELSLRWGQPAVLGELLAGILLGPSVLTGLVPQLKPWIVPGTAVQGYLLEVIGLLGALFLLLITGLETDLPLIRRHWRTAVAVSLGGISTTFASGFLLGCFLPETLLVRPEQRLLLSLFLATSMSISAIAVLAKVLRELNLMRRSIGQTLLASAMIDDTVGWVLLSVVVGLAGGATINAGSVALAAGKVVLFLSLGLTLGRWFVVRAVSFVQDEIQSRDRLMTLITALMLAGAAASMALGLEAVLGAFLVGVLCGQTPRVPESVRHSLESLTLGIFAPIFFALAGLKVNVASLMEPDLMAITLLMILVAIAGKIAGTFAGARWIGGCDVWTSLSFGAGLNARGALEILIATVGLSLGLLTQELFSMIVVMALTTSLMAPSALRFLLRRLPEDQEEADRLRSEDRQRSSLMHRIRRVLVPVRARPGDPNQHHLAEARILCRLASRQPLSVTLLVHVEPGERTTAAAYLERLAEALPGMEVRRKVLEGKSAADTILDEAARDYDLLMLGAPEHGQSSDVLFHPLVDHLVSMAPCTTLIVHGHGAQADWDPRQILVPTNGTAAARHAAEFAMRLCSPIDDELVVLHVASLEDRAPLHASGSLWERKLAAAHEIVEEMRKIGESSGVATVAEVREGGQPEEVILEQASRLHADLVILGTDLRVGTSRLYLGSRVERILSDAPCPVIVVNAR